MSTTLQLEQNGQNWFNKALELIGLKDYVSLENHMKQAKEDYSIEYEILACIGMLTESGKGIEDVEVSPEVVFDIQLTNENPVMYKLKTIIGDFTISKLSEFFPLMKDDTIENHNARQRKCHEKAFEMATKCYDDVQLVTSHVSVLSDIHTFLHSWVECESVGATFDYSFNAVIKTSFYKALMHPVEPPLLRINNSELRNGNIGYNQWAKMVNDLYG